VSAVCYAAWTDREVRDDQTRGGLVRCVGRRRRGRDGPGARAGLGGDPLGAEASEDELSVAGGVVVHRSTLKGERASTGGAPVRFENKYFDVLRKKADGGYELTRRMWSSNLGQ